MRRHGREVSSMEPIINMPTCNGDGAITIPDATLVNLNYGLKVPDFTAFPDQPVIDSEIGLRLENNKEELSADEGSPLQLLLRTEIFLGTEENPVEGLYGITFTILYDTSLMETSMVFPFIGSLFPEFLGEETENLSISMAMPEAGRLDLGICKTDGQEFSGWGKIGQFYLQLRDDALTGDPEGTRDIVYQVVNLKAIDFAENLLDLGARSDTTLATDLVYDPTITSTQTLELDEGLRLSPNPNSGQLQVQLGKDSNFEQLQLKLFNTQGQMVFSQVLPVAGRESSLQLPSKLNNGMYLVLLSDTEGRQTVRKLIIER